MSTAYLPALGSEADERFSSRSEGAVAGKTANRIAVEEKVQARGGGQAQAMGHQAKGINLVDRPFYSHCRVIETAKIASDTGKNGLPLSAALNDVTQIVGAESAGSGHENGYRRNGKTLEKIKLPSFSACGQAFASWSTRQLLLNPEKVRTLPILRFSSS